MMVIKHCGRFFDASPPEKMQACPPSESWHAYYDCFIQKTGAEMVLCDFQGRWYKVTQFLPCLLGHVFLKLWAVSEPNTTIQ